MIISRLVVALAPMAAATSVLPLPNRLVWQFPQDTWIENIAIRPNGNLLLTSLAPQASLYEVSDPAGASPSVAQLFSIGGVGSLLGIAETSHDVFAVVGGNFSLTAGGIKGTFGLWSVDFNGNNTGKRRSPAPKLITALPDATLLNGATTLPQRRSTVLIADSTLGRVWRVDTATGTVDVAVQVREMSSGSANPVGINGLHVRDGHLWWTNYAQVSLFRIRITDDGLPAPGAQAEKMAQLPSSFADDFIFGPADHDVAWVATDGNNTVLAVKADGDTAVVAGTQNSATVAYATACAFGRTRRDDRILYVSTGAGGVGEAVVGGKVQAIDTSGFQC